MLDLTCFVFELLGLGHDEKGFHGCDTNYPFMEPRILQIDQSPYELPAALNMSFESLTSLSTISVLFELLGFGHDGRVSR